MAFPKTISGIAIGWEKLGEKESGHEEGNPWDVLTFTTHKFCGRKVYIGKENRELFEYCPRCLIKLQD